MISVATARERILASLAPLASESIMLSAAAGRVLAEDLAARVTQPPADVSSMDGYAARAVDVARVPVDLILVGEAPAGGAFAGAIGPGQCVRIFTGAPLPAGADAIVLQENVVAAGAAITVNESVAAGKWIRRAGLDFASGAVGLKRGTRLGARDIGLAAAMNRPWVKVSRQPVVAILSTGNELVQAGEPIGPNQIVSSNALALAALIRDWGGLPIDLGIAVDTAESVQSMAAGARGADLLVTCGGASVGDYDLVRQALSHDGLALDFWQIAMRPGKPLSWGRIGAVGVLGLPGNPVSSFVCAMIFLRPAMMVLQGAASDIGVTKAVLGRDLPANDRREDYLRATLSNGVATPFPVQDSSMISVLARADCLAIRPALAPPAKAGDPIDIVPLTRSEA